MADPALHIKDAYFFEVPKFAFPCNHTKPSEFPPVWLKLDPTVQLAEAFQLAEDYPIRDEEQSVDGQDVFKSTGESVEQWKEWSADNHHAPYDVFYEETQSSETEHKPIPADIRKSVEQKLLGDTKWLDEEVATKWSEQGLLEKYNKHLSGKIIIKQPFGELRNLHEAESGFCISKFMLVELVVVSVVVLLFARLGKSISGGKPAKGTLANFLETFLLFIRDEVVRPSIGSDADFHHEHDDHHDDDHAHGTDEEKPDTFTKADKITPILWTIFFFILTCNLFGLIPFIGSPTGTFAVTGGLAVAIFLTSLISGSIMHGPVGFWLAQLPSMDLHISIGIIIKPMLWVIEVIGLFIKHAVLAIRLLANMVAGHMVLLSIMGMAIAAADGSIYWGVAPAAMLGATCIGMLELFVAFLQAYVFTLLSALFIGAAMHDH